MIKENILGVELKKDLEIFYEEFEDLTDHYNRVSEELRCIKQDLERIKMGLIRILAGPLNKIDLYEGIRKLLEKEK